MSDRPTIAEIAEAIADGKAVDWASAEAAATTDADRAAVRRLKSLEQLASRRRPSTGATPPRAGALPRATAPVGDASTWHWGHLTIVEKVGEGAFGEVYRAHDPKLARDVALKLLRTPASAGADATTAIEEGRLLARVRHPNVVTVYGADRIDGRVGVWMEFLHGRTLEQVLAEHGPFAPDEAARIGVDLARALAAVHDAGLVHGDVKAQNVMREPAGRLVLMDFGTGREHVRPVDDAIENLAGTPLYLAPEVLRGEPATVRADIYSLGVLLFHLVTGAYPVTARTLRDFLAAHDSGTQTRLDDARPGLPRAFVRVVERAIAPNPADRYASAHDVEAALSEVLTAHSPTGAPPQKVMRPVMVAAAITTTAVLAALGWLWRSGAFRQAPERATGSVIATPAPVAPSASPKPPPPGPNPPAPSSQVAVAPTTNATAPRWVLIGAFENRTGESALDGGTTERALTRELSQAPDLKVASQARIDDALQVMRQPAGVVLTPGIARDVCLRDGGIHTLITGRVDKQGQRFVVTAEVVEPAEGRVIGGPSEEAQNLALLPAAIRREALAIRKQLGERADSIEASRASLQHVTTPSMEALRLYMLGLTARTPTQFATMKTSDPDVPDLPQQEHYFREAIALDPEFASAHLWLALTIRNTPGRSLSEATASLDQAGRLAESATPFERDLIEGTQHYWRVQKAKGAEQQAEARMAAQAFEAALVIEPGDSLALTRLNSIYHGVLHLPFDVSERNARWVDLRPLSFGVNVSAAVVKMRAGDVRSAAQYYDRAARINPTGSEPFFRLFPTYQAWAGHDVKGASGKLDQELGVGGDLSSLERARFASEATEMLLTLGQWSRAKKVAAAIPEDQERLRIAAMASVVEVGGEPASLAALLRPHLDEFMGFQLKDAWVSAGLFAEARHVMQKYGTDPVTNLRILDGKGSYAEVVSVGDSYLTSLKDADPSPRVLTLMARALRNTGKLDRAIALLEPCSTLSPAVVNMRWPAYEWLSLRADLAALYRKSGDAPRARKIEEDLRRWLVAADPDFPLVVELNQLVGR